VVKFSIAPNRRLKKRRGLNAIYRPFTSMGRCGSRLWETQATGWGWCGHSSRFALAGFDR